MAAATYETPTQFERDLRSNQRQWNRTKDSTVKWAKGVRSAAGVKTDFTGRPLTGSESQHSKTRPKKLAPSASRRADGNMVKTRGSCGMSYGGRVHNKVHARAEASDTGTRSQADVVAQPESPLSSVHGDIFYSFDCAESPGRPLTLEIFVKPGRDTERFVEQEYEVIDGHGEPLKGRKARRNLRKAATVELDLAPMTVQDELEDDGFELV